MLIAIIQAVPFEVLNTLLVRIPRFKWNGRIIEICSNEASVKISDSLSLNGWLDESEIEMFPCTIEVPGELFPRPVGFHKSEEGGAI